MTQYYVKNGGSDAANGLSDGTAFATLAKASTLSLLPGDTVSLKCGSVFREAWFCQPSGSSGLPITINSYSTGAKPVISGADVLTTWTTEGTIYYKALAVRPASVIAAGVNLREVATKAAMQPGTWFWDSVNLRAYVRLTGDANPSGVTMEASVRTYPLRMHNNSDWVVDGIHLYGADLSGMFADTNNRWQISNCEFSCSAGNGVHIYTHTALSTSGGLVEACVAHHNGATGITIAGNFATNIDDITIRGNETHNNNWNTNPGFEYNGGIRPIGREITNCVVEDNYVHDEGFDNNFSRGCGIWFDTVGAGCVCRRNRIERTTSWGIQVEDCDGMLVHSNILKGTIYFPAIAIIRNCNYNRVFNNTIMDCWGGFDLSNFNGSSFVGNEIFNNIVSNYGVYAVQSMNGVNGFGNVTFTRNLFGPEKANFVNWNGNKSTYAAWDAAYGTSMVSYRFAPIFESPSSERITSATVGWGAGLPVPANTLDFASDLFLPAPNIGAYEVSHAGLTVLTTVSAPWVATATTTYLEFQRTLAGTTNLSGISYAPIPYTQWIIEGTGNVAVSSDTSITITV